MDLRMNKLHMPICVEISGFHVRHSLNLIQAQLNLQKNSITLGYSLTNDHRFI